MMRRYGVYKKISRQHRRWSVELHIYIYDYDEHHDECDITALQSSRASLSCVRRARSTRLGEEY